MWVTEKCSPGEKQERAVLISSLAGGQELLENVGERGRCGKEAGEEAASRMRMASAWLGRGGQDSKGPLPLLWPSPSLLQVSEAAGALQAGA